MPSQPTQVPRRRRDVADSEMDRNLSQRRRSRKTFPLPRRCYTPPHSPSYNRIIRLEGQILTLVSIIRFHLRYAPFSFVETAHDALRLGPLPIYFHVIEELVGHIDHGCDFNYQRSAGDLVHMAQMCWFNRVREQRGEEEVEGEGQWPKILWLAEMQRILEDETLGLGQALIAGWKWFMDPDGFPTKFGGLGEWAMGWHKLEVSKQEQFMCVFKVDADSLPAMAKGVESMSLNGSTVLVHEEGGCVQTFLAQKRTLDVVMPRMLNPSKQKLGACSICDEALLKGYVGTKKEHRPVEIPCGHIFGFSCIKQHFAPSESWSCPVCNRDLLGSPHHPTTSSEMVESCDRVLRWLGPPTNVVVPAESQSYLEKLTLIFEPADAIRKNFYNWLNLPQESYAELLRLRDMSLYLARDRLDAAVRSDTTGIREIVAQQMQVTARFEWLEFLGRCHPNSPAAW